MRRTMPKTSAGRPSSPANQRPLSSSQIARLAVPAVGPEQIFDLEGNAVAFVDADAAHHGVIAAGEIVGIEEVGEGAARCERLRAGTAGRSAALALQKISSDSIIQ